MSKKRWIYVQVAIYPETHKLLKLLSESLGMSEVALISHALAYIYENIDDFVKFVAATTAKLAAEAVQKMQTKE